MSDVVLVHGTTQSPDGWARVARELEGHGHVVWSVDVTRVAPDAPFDTLVTDIVAQVPDLDRPVVAAHSGSGALLPALARRLGACRQVFVSAWIPDGAHSLIGEHTQDPAAMFHPEWIGVDPGTDPELARWFLFHDCDAETLAWALTTLRTVHPQTMYHTPVEAPDRTIESAAIVAGQGRALRADWGARAARERLGVEPVVLDAGHCPHVSRPAAVAAVITPPPSATSTARNARR